MIVLFSYFTHTCIMLLISKMMHCGKEGEEPEMCTCPSHDAFNLWPSPPPLPGGTQPFSGRGVRHGFPKCGACKLIFATKREVLWTEIFKFGGLRAKIWTKIEAVGVKISFFFLKRESWELTFKLFCLKWDPCELRERLEKGVFRAAHPHTRFLGQCQPASHKSSFWDILEINTVPYEYTQIYNLISIEFDIIIYSFKIWNFTR